MYCLREELQVPHSIVGAMMVAIYSQGFWSLHPGPLSDLYLARLLGVLGRRATEHLLGGRRLLGTEHGLGTEHCQDGLQVVTLTRWTLTLPLRSISYVPINGTRRKRKQRQAIMALCSLADS